MDILKIEIERVRFLLGDDAEHVPVELITNLLRDHYTMEAAEKIRAILHSQQRTA